MITEKELDQIFSLVYDLGEILSDLEYRIEEDGEVIDISSSFKKKISSCLKNDLTEYQRGLLSLII